MIFPSLSHQGPVRYLIIYVLSIIFALHSSLVVFINSSYIERFVTPEIVGALFMIGSSIAVISFLFISRILQKVGNVRLTIWLTTLEIIALVVLGLTNSSAVAIVAFVFFLTANPLLFLNLDIFSESIIGENEGTTGYKRGLLLTLISIAAMIGPLSISFISGPNESHLERVYLVAAGVFSIFLFLILTRFRSFKDPIYGEVRVLTAISKFWRDKNIRFSLIAQFILQLVFSWFIIYIPLYLISVIGMSWADLGIAIAIGTIAYVLFEFPIGYLADNYFGEKEMMSSGFVIMSLTVMSIAYINTPSLITWVIIMFILRVGASLVETTVESYFFKHTKGSDTNFLSFFRLTRPLAVMFGGLLGSASLLFLPFNQIFIVLGLVIVIGIFASYQIEDTL